jgi:hypothetical protein
MLKLSRSAATCCLILLLQPNSAFSKDSVLLGEVEKVLLTELGVTLNARVDLEARMSSLDTRNIKIQGKKNRRNVIGRIYLDKGKIKKLNARIVRMEKVKVAGIWSKKHPVITVALCLGKKLRLVEVILRNRKDMKYRMSLGRNVLGAGYTLNLDKEFLTTPRC